MVDEKKIRVCGECKEFLYEASDGFGICGITSELAYCGSLCQMRLHVSEL